MNNLREDFANALLASFGGRFYLSKGKALAHADNLIAAGFGRTTILTKSEEFRALNEGAMVESTFPGTTPSFFIKREDFWHDIDGGALYGNSLMAARGAAKLLRN